MRTHTSFLSRALAIFSSPFCFCKYVGCLAAIHVVPIVFIRLWRMYRIVSIYFGGHCDDVEHTNSIAQNINIYVSR